ncbi:hypothetical protein PMI42_04852 [Bradyrhizobium sp. YR681]|uniref:hypothetical protein n=1 Tax=Bradyrhizobium sp. YR681 TaxID=1144344 RepID=UPI0002710D39|nr:hypothetical protein [Bradyrhizobium sp. YR681]EJN11837.1 hypothetical protein PMI42_04852 [Bradyrhizobium sp. YR681]
MRNALVSIGSWLARTFDVRDVMLTIGLLLLAGGFYLVWPPAALIVPGAIVTAVAVFASRINSHAEEG